MQNLSKIVVLRGEERMVLTRNQFEVLRCYAGSAGATQRAIVKNTGLSLGTVSATVGDLKQAGFVDEDGSVTELGLTELGPYRVDNAVIMAAGLSSRFAPISYERPKGVLTVDGEVLIERQIRQLQAAGIDDITVVVGYKKEEFFYLEDLLGVRIVVNPHYAERNNNSSIYLVKDRLSNTYICSSDDYFEENPFEPYVYDSYYAAVYMDGPTDEWCLKTKGRDKTIVGVEVGGSDSWVMLGHVYWSREFSQAFARLLERVYDGPATAPKLWEDIYAEHMAELPPLHMRTYRNGVIWEFDSLEDLRHFDPSFIDNVDSLILDNICGVLDCERSAIRDIVPIKKGMTNTSFRFEVDGKRYVYRHPGYGSDEITNRRAEARFQEVARDLGLDSTFVHEDPEKGWKISRYIEGARDLDYHDWDDVARAMKMIRRLHESGLDCGFVKDMHEDTLLQIKLLDERRRTQFKDFGELLDLADSLNKDVMADGLAPVPCHNDFYDQNFLITDQGMDLIDWEFAGMSDYASDLAVFIACCPDYTYEDALKIYGLYFGRDLTERELFHCVAYTAVVSFHWFVWALYKDACGEPVGEFLYYYYRYTKLFGAKALELKGESA